VLILDDYANDVELDVFVHEDEL